MPEITPLTRKVLVIDFRTAAVPAHWHRSDALIPQYIESMKKASQDILQYQVVETMNVADYPSLLGERQYTDKTYAAVLADDKSALRDAQGNYLLANYDQIIQKYDLLQKVQSGQIDEVWMFGGPYFGFYESRMVGRGAFWCNGPAIEKDCRRFVIMGFNYERDVKEMIHDYGHRSESLLAKQFHSDKYLRNAYSLKASAAPANVYEKFLSGHGTVHRKPGGKDYSQDEFAWLSAMQVEWWPPTIDPNLVQVAPKPWYRVVMDFFISLLGRK